MFALTQNLTSKVQSLDLSAASRLLFPIAIQAFSTILKPSRQPGSVQVRGAPHRSLNLISHLTPLPLVSPRPTHAPIYSASFSHKNRIPAYAIAGRLSGPGFFYREAEQIKWSQSISRLFPKRRLTRPPVEGWWSLDSAALVVAFVCIK